jgi:hypothetical protein
MQNDDEERRKIIEGRMTGISWRFGMGKVSWLSHCFSQHILGHIAVMLGKDSIMLSSNRWV